MFTEGFEKTAKGKVIKSFRKWKRRYGSGISKKKLALVGMGVGAAGAGAYAARQHGKKIEKQYNKIHGKGASDMFDPNSARDVKRLLKIQGIR